MNDVKLFLESCQSLMLYALVTLCPFVTKLWTRIGRTVIYQDDFHLADMLAEHTFYTTMKRTLNAINGYDNG